MDANQRELEILKFWEENKTFEQSLEKAAPQGEFVFYEGPPTANGRPGIHHLAARSYKDIIPRYKTMRGYHVRRKAGWDTHGLPVELAVEKALGFKSKKEIEGYGIAAFNQKCKESVWEYKAEWEKFTARIGFWLDQAHPYVTYENDYIESLWNLFKQIEDQHLLYRDYKVVPWCPRCGTALSSHELAQGYKEVSDTAVYVKFKIIADKRLFQVLGKNPQTAQKSPLGSVYLLAWTTTPWTLPGNVALAVGEKINYQLTKEGDDYLIKASESDNPILGRDLVGLKYEPLFNFPALQNDKSHQVYAADFVTTKEGTGIVHTAVMYGADDFELGTKIGLPKSHLVGEDGRFIAVTPWAGKKVTEVGPEITADLEARGLLFKEEKYTHTYPFCWRCQTALIYYARDSWYILMSELRSDLVRENEKVSWTPAHIKEGRFGEWLREIKDWAISRERYWGTPLPIWENSDRSKRLVIGSLDELKQRVKKSGNKYFVMRHGEAENNAQGVVDSTNEKRWPLTDQGRQQVLAAAAKLESQNIKQIYASPFERTRQTAELLAEQLGLAKEAIIYDDRLRELNFGDLNGQTFAKFLEYEEKNLKSYADSLPGGESYLDAKRRFGDFIYELESNLTNKNILVVTHGIGPEVLGAIVGGVGLVESKKILEELEPPVGAVSELDFTPLPHNHDYELDLHRPFIDEVVLVKDGEEYKRVLEVADVWFDSGAMPFAQDHYPFAGTEIAYPADYIAEALDQTRGWFYTLLALGVLTKRGAPYRHVVCLGLLLDKQGKKMSKSVGNVVDPWEMLAKYGADALRLWFYSVNQPGEAKRFDEVTVRELGQKPLTLLLNVLAFYKLYPATGEDSSSHVLDQWLMERVTITTSVVTDLLDNYQIFEAARFLVALIDDLSTWYLRRSRERLRSGGTGANNTLRSALSTIARLLAPFAPFVAESVWREIRSEVDPVSVHLVGWPEAKMAFAPSRLESMAEVRRLASLGLEARAKANLKVRQPLARATIATPDLDEALQAILAEELNVKEIVVDKNSKEPIILDTTLTPELEAEGQLRELVRALQEERKKAGLAPGQLANATLAASGSFRKVIEANLGHLKQAASLSELKITDDVVDDLPFSRIHLAE